MIGVLTLLSIKVFILLLVSLILTHKKDNNDDHKDNFEPDEYFLISRPTVYAGMQTTTKTPLYFGMMYHDHDEERGGFVRLRERVNYQDRLNFKVIRTDPTKFCNLEIHDDLHNNVKLDVKWLKPKNDSFMFRISGDFFESEGCKDTTTSETYLSIFLYLGISEGEIHDISTDTIEGYSSNFGPFKLSTTNDGMSQHTSHFFSTHNNRPFSGHDLTHDILLHGTNISTNPSCCYPLNHDRFLPDLHGFEVNKGGISPIPSDQKSKTVNFGILQKVMKIPFSWTVKFEPLTPGTSDNFDQLYAQDVAKFGSEFDKKFPLSNSLIQKATKDEDSRLTPSSFREFGLRVLSGLLNGFSYFQGIAYIKNPESGLQWSVERELFSFIPGKIGFPRAFFWDEGFHQSVIHRFRPSLHEKITESWYGLMNQTTGWIAREQIIGPECHDTSPEWAWAGLTDQQNPPSFFLASYDYSRGYDRSDEMDQFRRYEFIRKMFPKFEKVFHWYLNECSRDVPYTYGWNGRKWSGDSAFDSGLDDFPRFPTFHASEKNVDLQAWLARVSGILEYWSSEILRDDEKTKYYNSLSTSILSKMEDLFWSEKESFYVDIRNTDNPLHFNEVGTPGVLPFALQVMAMSKEARILDVFKRLNSSLDLYTDFGIASLSKRSPHFKRTGNYWRGNIWININYLIFQAIYTRYETQKSFEWMREFREIMEFKIAKNMFLNYYGRGTMKSGIYECFHPLNGVGYNHLPFVGWSSLVLLLMSQSY